MENFENDVLDLVKSNMREDLASTASLSVDSHLITDLGYDSIRLMGLFFSIEQDFNLSIINSCANYEFFSVETVGDLVGLLKSKINEN
ncbi:MAG: acyl carrier protein [Clostridia bacterium]|nr:acyl carrier protein [Clostridia bacterium]